jgi:replicative DNA helicase
MVILLHREDAYERESPRAGEADLIVAKHRNGPTDTIVVAFQGHYARFVDMAH